MAKNVVDPIRKAALEGVRAGMKIVQAHAKSKAPKLTGRFAKSIRRSARLSRTTEGIRADLFSKHPLAHIFERGRKAFTVAPKKGKALAIPAAGGTHSHNGRQVIFRRGANIPAMAARPFMLASVQAGVLGMNKIVGEKIAAATLKALARTIEVK